MEFDHAFTVPLPPAEAWALLMDIERIAPCMPGAELTQNAGDGVFKGRVGVKLGPVALSFAGTARFETVDDVARTARVKAGGVDAKGRGGANAVIGFRLEPAPAGSNVAVHTSLTLSGSVAQYGRGVGMIQDVAAELINQFSANLRQMIEADRPQVPEAPPQPPPPPAKPISGLALLLRALWRSVSRLFASKS